ncbi:hypothetical protein AB1Y20_013562 [Prymnesium parvum]|uniref:Uncharacterized protein n=1 Tax=Prymnesium parvum TaxID=97485 RepID=A0AB34IJC9_PRYPA
MVSLMGSLCIADPLAPLLLLPPSPSPPPRAAASASAHHEGRDRAIFPPPTAPPAVAPFRSQRHLLGPLTWRLALCLPLSPSAGRFPGVDLRLAHLHTLALAAAGSPASHAYSRAPNAQRVAHGTILVDHAPASQRGEMLLVRYLDEAGRLLAESEPFRGPQQAARRASVTCRSADTHGTIADFELLDGQPAAEHDFVALCKAGCAIDEYITYEYLAHPPAAVGTVMLARDEYTEPGSYVLRYTCGGDYSIAGDVVGQSAPFQVLEEGCSTFRSMDYAEIFPPMMKS